jgi:hypothetical protein
LRRQKAWFLPPACARSYAQAASSFIAAGARRRFFWLPVVTVAFYLPAR